MGQILSIKCQKCGFEKEIFAGGGRDDCNMSAILLSLPAEKQKILSEADKRGITSFSIMREPCLCAICGEIFALPIVNYTSENISYELRGDCPKCGKENPESNPPCKCPECGGELLSDTVGHWD